MIRGWPVAIACAVVIGGCRDGRADALGAEALRIAAAVSALREAPNGEKAPLLRRLAKTPCTAPDLCRLRSICLGGYERHDAAIARTREVRGELGAGNLETLARSLASAELELKAAHEQVTECARVEAEIRKRYRL